MSLAWLWLVDGVRPNGWDLAGAGCAVLGTLLILFGGRFTR
jgi:small multidrug resistance family-3 protein